MGWGRVKFDGTRRPTGLSEDEVARWELKHATANGSCLDGRRPFHSFGYPMVTIRGKAHKVATLVCQMRHGPRPENGIVRHLCDRARCINPEHVEWSTQHQNWLDKSLVGTGHQTLMPEDVREIRRSYRTNGVNRSNRRELAAHFGITPKAICDIIYGRSWSWLK